MKTGQNTFVALLDLLKVKHTGEFSNRYFNEHPHKYSLYGLSKMLSDYGVVNVGTRIADKENDLFNIECPFIAHFGGDFVVVYKVETPKSHEGDLDLNSPFRGQGLVHYLWKGIDHDLPVSEFIQAWTGVVLLAESSEKSIEPEYEEHRKKERLNFLKKAALFFLGSLILLWVYIHQSLQLSVIQLFSYSTLLFLNITGVYISYLLLLKQMHVQSQYADKICSLFKQNDCNHVLESKASKLWGIFGWSEIGLGYFSTNLLALLFFPELVTYIALINILTLPYSFWSVWYQKVKAKQWCVLCLITQVLLWAIFIVNCLSGYIQIPTINHSVIQLLSYLILLGCCYSAAILAINALVPKLNADRIVPFLRQAINSLKADENVFGVLLKQQPFYETKYSDSIIRFGNPDSPLQLTILTNPYCNPCAMMHKRIERLLQKTNNDIGVQYILSSFDESLNDTNKYLIAACLKNCHCELDPQTPENNLCHCGLDPQSPERLFTNWFEKGKQLKEAFFENMQLDITNPAIDAEFEKHNAWKEKTQIRATPTILVNGYKLPDNYKIEDLRYFTEAINCHPALDAGSPESEKIRVSTK